MKGGIRVDKNELCYCKRIVGSVSCVRGRRREKGGEKKRGDHFTC
jgi:hypothetical protein